MTTQTGQALTPEQALAWFGEPRYSVTDLQRAWAQAQQEVRYWRNLNRTEVR